LTKNNSTIGPN